MTQMFRQGLAVDVETTGLTSRDEIIELAAVSFTYDGRSGRIVEVRDGYVGMRQPQVAINPSAMRVNGITEAELVGQSLDEVKIRKMIASSDIMLAHNAAFDRRFVAGLFPEALRKPWYCSMNGVQWHQMGYGSKALQSLAREMGISVERAHRGLDDTLAMLEILQRRPRRDGLPFSTHLFGAPPMYR